MTRLRAEQIELGYGSGGAPIVEEFNLTLSPGQFTGVVGPNGSGKSTLVRALSRTLRPQRGVVLLNKDNLYTQVSARESAGVIGAVPQETAIAFEFTVRDVVGMGRSPHLPRRPFAAESLRDQEIIRSAMVSADILHLADRPVMTLSGGERQRVLFARALAQEPQVILLDEPTAHLDIHQQTQVLSLARSLAHEQEKAVLAVLHDLNLAAAFCDRLVLMNNGLLVAEGSPAEVLTASNVHRVYGARVWVRCHPTSGRPVILSLPESPFDPSGAPEWPADRTVHVVCGGGTGAGILVALRQQGIPITACGLNAGDTDQEAAEMLGVFYVAEAPFTALSAKSVGEERRLALAASVNVVTDVPIGPANLANLEAAAIACEAGVPTVCLQPADTDFESRNFAGAAASDLWRRLLTGGASIAADVDALLSIVRAQITDS